MGEEMGVTLFEAVIKEVREHFDRAHRGWRGSINSSTRDDNAVWVELVAPRGGNTMLLRVTSEGDTVWASEFGIQDSQLGHDKFCLEEASSIERLLSFLDLWVEKRK